MKCTILPNWAFRKDGSCKRESTCPTDRLKICRPTRARVAKTLKKLYTLRDRLRRQISSTKNPMKISQSFNRLDNIRAVIAGLSK